MATTWTDYRGRKWPVCSCLKAWLPVYQAELIRLGVIRAGLDVYQAIGNAPASAGYHKGGGNVDTGQRSTKAIEIARQMGGAAWSRGPADGMTPHAHITLKGCPHMTYGPRWQVTELEAGRNGLARRGKDNGPRSGIKWPLRSYKAGIAWAKARQKPKTSLRFATYNVPGGDKISRPTTRAKAAAALVNAGASPALVGWNELVGMKSVGVPSDFARSIDAALGSKWLLVKPTKFYNENYISYDKNILQLVARYDDSILEAKTGGRHLTRAVFKVRKTGFVFAVGQTHLVNGSTEQHKKDRQTQAADALASIKAVTAKHGDCPFIIQGDMNTSGFLTALVNAGMKRTRTYADNAAGRDDSTYTNIDRTVPSTNKDWAIDQSYVSGDFYCVGYTVRRKLAGKKYAQPRASDHDLVVSSVRI